MRFLAAWLFLLTLAAGELVFLSVRGNNVAPKPRLAGNFVGFDRNDYPGDDSLPVLRQTFVFAGYWLSPPPGAKSN